MYQKSQVKWPGMKSLQPESLPSFLRSCQSRESQAALPASPAQKGSHPLGQPREREEVAACAAGRESRGKKRSIHVINRTLFLPIAEERKGTFPSGSGERKGPLWGQKPALVIRKETPTGSQGLQKRKIASVLKASDRDILKAGLSGNTHLLPFFLSHQMLEDR